MSDCLDMSFSAHGNVLDHFVYILYAYKKYIMVMRLFVQLQISDIQQFSLKIYRGIYVPNEVLWTEMLLLALFNMLNVKDRAISEANFLQTTLQPVHIYFHYRAFINSLTIW